MIQHANSCCSFKIEAMVSVDERGQMVLPKEVRAKAGLNPGDKLALITWERDGAVCCMSLVKNDALMDMVREFMGPFAQDLLGGGQSKEPNK